MTAASTATPTEPTKKRRRNGPNRMRPDARIVICGGGLAGLAAALALERAGFTDITIIERDESFDVQKEGYGLTLSYQYPKGPLAKLGLMERVAQQDCPSRAHYVFDSSGKVLGYFGNAFLEGRGCGQRGNLRVPRKVLRRILLDALQVTRIMWGHRLVEWQRSKKVQKSDTPASVGTKDAKSQSTNCYNLTLMNMNERETSETGRQGSQRFEVRDVDLLVAADGIRSGIVQALYERHFKPKYAPPPPSSKSTTVAPATSILAAPTTLSSIPTTNLTEMTHAAAAGLSHMGVRLVYGLANFEHPLLDERGFYSLDGTHRLFTMPFESNQFEFASSSTDAPAYGPSDGDHADGDRADGDDGRQESKRENRHQAKRNRIMWQLSFRTTAEEQTMSLQPDDLLRDVLKRTADWHNPVQAMIRRTPIETVWGTDLQDRDPAEVQRLILNHNYQRLVVIGDAIHSMSPFKGQGANQALQDGPLLAHWLHRASPEAAVRNTNREIVQRTAPVVRASRQAAKELHSPTVLCQSTAPEAHSWFAGVKEEHASQFLSTLEERCVTAALGGKLDANIQKVIDELDVGSGGVVQSKASSGNGCDTGTEKQLLKHREEEALALEYCENNDIQSLRLLSLQQGGSERIRTAGSCREHSQQQQQRCVHVASRKGFVMLLKWLVREVRCPLDVVDDQQRTALDVACNDDTRAMILRLQSLEEERNRANDL